jgi:transposase-like protein
LAVVDGYRESTQSWRELLQQLKRQGFSTAPKLAVGDGSLGFWLALQEEYGPVAQQRCWVHKTANILDKMPKSVQGRAKQLIHEMYLSPTRKAASAAYDQFIASYQAKYPKATECLEKDQEWLFTFYDFPAQHWSHLRTTNPIESTFATVRLRTQRTKGSGSRIATLTMVFKLGVEAQKHWRRLNGSESARRQNFMRLRNAWTRENLPNQYYSRGTWARRQKIRERKQSTDQITKDLMTRGLSQRLVAVDGDCQ